MGAASGSTPVCVWVYEEGQVYPKRQGGLGLRLNFTILTAAADLNFATFPSHRRTHTFLHEQEGVCLWFLCKNHKHLRRKIDLS